MDNNGKKRINDYYRSNQNFKNKILALSKKWIPMKNKSFNLWEALECIYDYANGNLLTMTDILTHLTDDKKLFGRANTAYGEENHSKIDIIRTEDGNLKLVGYDINDPLTLKGQHGIGADPNRLKKDGSIKQIVRNKEEVLMNVGAIVRKIYPKADKNFIEMVDSAILKIAEKMHKSPIWIANQMLNGKLKFDDKNMEIIKNENINRKVIVITEETASIVRDELTMTEYKFNSAVKKFLHDILVDPINAEVPTIFKFNGFNKSKLLKYLIGTDLVRKEQTIHDKDENGEPVTATMKVKYNVPKKNFDRKLKKLFIKLFEKNVPEIQRSEKEELTEDGEGCCDMGTTNASSSGQFNSKVFPMQRRQMNYEIEETTTTCNTGDYSYEVPFIGDKETLARNNGIGGSVSINK